MADSNMSPLILFPIPRLYFHGDFFILFCILQADTALAFSIKKKKEKK